MLDALHAFGVRAMAEHGMLVAALREWRTLVVLGVIKKTAAAAALALSALLLTPATPATSAEPPVRTIQGHGLGACPAEALCLCDRPDFNGTQDGPIWVVTDTVDSLAAYGAGDKASSMYLNTSPVHSRYYSRES